MFMFCLVLIFHVSREISKPLIPLGKAGVLLAHILTLLCKEMVRSNHTFFFSNIKLLFFLTVYYLFYLLYMFSNECSTLKTCRTWSTEIKCNFDSLYGHDEC